MYARGCGVHERELAQLLARAPLDDDGDGTAHPCTLLARVDRAYRRATAASGAKRDEALRYAERHLRAAAERHCDDAPVCAVLREAREHARSLRLDDMLSCTIEAVAALVSVNTGASASDETVDDATTNDADDDTADDADATDDGSDDDDDDGTSFSEVALGEAPPRPSMAAAAVKTTTTMQDIASLRAAAARAHHFRTVQASRAHSRHGGALGAHQAGAAAQRARALALEAAARGTGRPPVAARRRRRHVGARRARRN